MQNRGGGGAFAGIEIGHKRLVGSLEKGPGYRVRSSFMSLM